MVILGVFVADTAYRAQRQPRMGETILGSGFALGPGGKGSNQAVAAARLGADVTFISKIGADPFGDMAMATWAEAGVKTEVGRGRITFKRGRTLKPLDITTLPYPGFPTDMQAQMMALLTQIPGISIITERIFEARFTHAAELARLGADVAIEGPSAIVKGGRPLSGAPVMASDLRASAALVIAGLVASGITQVNRIYHLDRGYERMEEKLADLGARAQRVVGR